MLAVAMVAAISVTMSAAPSATAAEERIIYFIGSTHDNADPSLTPYDSYSSLFDAFDNNALTSGQMSSFGAHPITPLVLASKFADLSGFGEPEFFRLDELSWDGTEYLEVATYLEVDVYSKADAGYAYLQDNELAVTLASSELTTDSANAGLAFNPDTYYRIWFEFNGEHELFVFKTKVPSGGGQQALVFNVGGIPMMPVEDVSGCFIDYDVPVEASRLLYSFTNEIPEVTQYGVSNSQYIHVYLGSTELTQGVDYTVTFHYPDTMTPPGPGLYEQWVAIQFVEVLLDPITGEPVLDPITGEPVLVPTDMVSSSTYKVVFDADNGYGTAGLSANNGNRLQNKVCAVFTTGP